MAGPGSNATGAGSNKRTLLNQYSKQTPYGANPVPSPADPSTYGGYAATVMGLQQQLAAAMALAKSGIGQAKAQFIMDKNAAQTGLVNDTTAAESGAIANGVIGGSGDLAQRAAAVDTAAAARQAALAQRTSTVAGIRGQQISAVGSYYTGLGSAQATLANQQAMQNIARFQNDSFDTMNANFNAFRDALLRRLANRGRTRDIPNYYGVLPPGAAPGAGGAIGTGVGTNTRGY